MSLEEVRPWLRGLILPVMTPFTEDDEIDPEGIRSQVEYYIKAGVKKGKGVLLAGAASGEYPSLSIEERKIVIRTVVEAAAGKVPVCAGTGHTSTRLVIELTKHAEKVGADCVQIDPPYYSAPSDAQIFAHYRAVDEAVEIPIMVYNTPWACGVNLSIPIMERLCTLHNVLSLKWSHDDYGTYMEMIKHFKDRLVIIENAMPHRRVDSFAAGARGFISHVGILWPAYDLEVFSLLERRKYGEVEEKLLKLAYPFHAFLSTHNYIAAIKAALEILGRPIGKVRLPLLDLDENEYRELRKLLKDTGVPGA